MQSRRETRATDAKKDAAVICSEKAMTVALFLRKNPIYLLCHSRLPQELVKRCFAIPASGRSSTACIKVEDNLLPEVWLSFDWHGLLSSSTGATPIRHRVRWRRYPTGLRNSSFFLLFCYMPIRGEEREGVDAIRSPKDDEQRESRAQSTHTRQRKR